jgi:hypothetical protein
VDTIGTDSPTGESINEHGILSAISNEMVRIYKEQFGRGPTKTRTQWAGPDIIIVTLEQTLTPAERNLVEMASRGACATCACCFSTRRSRPSAIRSRV